MFTFPKFSLTVSDSLAIQSGSTSQEKAIIGVMTNADASGT